MSDDLERIKEELDEVRRLKEKLKDEVEEVRREREGLASRRESFGHGHARRVPPVPPEPPWLQAALGRKNPGRPVEAVDNARGTGAWLW